MDSDTLNRVAKGVAFGFTLGVVWWLFSLLKQFINWIITQFKK